MLGPDYLFSPVTTYNATSWQVYLPAIGDGSSESNAAGQSGGVAATWVHHYTNKTYAGGAVHTIDVSDLDTFPLFKRTNPKYATV